MAYSDKVLDHYNNPRNVGSMDKNDPNVGTGMVGAPECGDVMKLQVKVNPETGVIEDAKFKTFGCGSAIASSSLATEWLRGKTVDEALAIKNTDIVNELSLPPVKIHCSVLAEDAIKAAIDDYKKKAATHDVPRTGAVSVSDAVDKPGEKMVTVTPKAVQKIREAFAREGVDGRAAPGRAGRRLLRLELSVQVRSQAARHRQGARISTMSDVFIDPKSLVFLDGMTLDWKDSLIHSGFVFENPHAKKSCGCGTSFSRRNAGLRDHDESRMRIL